jgi:hypothetical protein
MGLVIGAATILLARQTGSKASAPARCSLRRRGVRRPLEHLVPLVLIRAILNGCSKPAAVLQRAD